MAWTFVNADLASKCSLHILLDRPDRTYRVGDKITGRVEVQVHEDCKCGKLTLRREWRVLRGAKEAHSTSALVLSSGPWFAGQCLIYPFKLDSCTEGPLTYRGKLFDVEWYLRARADLGAFARVKSEENFTLVADSAGAEALPLSFARQDEQLKPLAFTNLPLVCLFLVFLAYAGFRHPIPWYYFILAFLLFCFYPVGLLRRLRRKLVERKVGPVAVKLGAAPAHAGEHLRWSVAFQPRRALHLTEATARLKSVERIKTGPQLEDYSEAAGYEREVSLASPQNLEAGQSVVFEGSIPLPAGAPYTFTGTRSSVRCEFDVRLKIGESLARWRARYWRGKYQINTIQKPDFVVEVEAFPTPGETSQRGDA